MGAGWYYATGDDRRGPVALEELTQLLESGAVAASDRVWTQGMEGWLEVSRVPEFARFAAAPPPAPPPIPPRAAEEANPPRRQVQGVLRNVAAGLSDLADMPTISDVPIKSLLLGGGGVARSQLEPEELFAAGTRATTPELAAIEAGWPRPRIFWRVLALGVAVFALMVVGALAFENGNFLPGMMVLGAFAVPLALVVFFFEMNAPRNVSSYRALEMVFLGGTLSLIATMVLGIFVPGSGVLRFGPALLTGLIEELAKLAPLLLVIRDRRYRWQLNGVLFGAAVGAGFSGLESAGYAFNALLEPDRFGPILENMKVRALLAPGGHVIWCAIAASAIWKVKGDQPFSAEMLFAPTVLKRLGTVIVLHGLWDTDPALYVPFADFGVYGIPFFHVGLIALGWYFIFGILKQSLQEVAAAKLAAGAP